MKNYFSLLDPLRFGAALSVAVFHLMFWSWAWSSINVPPGFEHYVAADVQFPSAAPFTWFGWVGVEIFFVISGFVIANSASKSSATEFLFSRALRLYPAVWVCSTLTFIVLLLFASGKASEFILPYLRAMLLIPKGIRGQWIDCIYWTLAAEMAFYGLVFCALLTKKVTLRHLAWGLTIYSGVFNGFSLLVLSGAIRSDILYFVVLMFRVPGATWLLCHGCFFALGIWLFISANRKLTALEQFAVAVTCLSGCAEIYYFSSFLLMNIPAISHQSAFVPIVVWAAAVLLIAVAANRSRRSTGTASPDAAGYLRTLGLITYPLYLTHNVIGSAIVRVLVHAGLDASLAVWVGLGHACPGLLAHLREDRARHWTSAKGNRFKLRTASENRATIEPSKSGSWAAPLRCPCEQKVNFTGRYPAPPASPTWVILPARQDDELRQRDDRRMSPVGTSGHADRRIECQLLGGRADVSHGVFYEYAPWF